MVDQFLKSITKFLNKKGCPSRLLYFPNSPQKHMFWVLNGNISLKHFCQFIISIIISARHFILCLVLVQPRKTHPHVTEKLLTEMKKIKEKKTKQVVGHHPHQWAPPGSWLAAHMAKQISYFPGADCSELPCLFVLMLYIQSRIFQSCWAGFPIFFG